MIDQIQLLESRMTCLKSDASSWIDHYRQISRYLLPRNGLFFEENNNTRGERKNQYIIDSSATRALRVSASGMKSDLISPSRKWFSLEIEDKDLMKYRPAASWIDEAIAITHAKINASNVHRVTHTMYEELFGYGVSAAFKAKSFDKVVILQHLAIGTYYIAANYNGDVDTLYREFYKSVAQVVKEFGIENVTNNTRSMFQRGQLDKQILIRHAVEPREDRDTKSYSVKDKKWKSCYWEPAGHNGKYLRESGFDNFEFIVARWSTNGNNVYGDSPGMDALGDIIQLQNAQYRNSQAIDYMVRPPLQIPISMRNRDNQFFPGGASYYDPAGGVSGGVKTAFDVNIDLQHLLSDIQDIRNRINQAFFTDLFQLISSDDGQRTAYEIASRNQEKISVIGGVVERSNTDILDPIVSAFFEACLLGGLFPEPPPELRGHNINVKYISILSEAAQSVDLVNIDRFTAGIGQMAQINPGVLDKYDTDTWVDVYADKLKVDPDLIIDNDKVAIIRQQRAEAQARAQQQQALIDAGGLAKNVGEIPDKGNIAAKVMEQMQR